MWFVSDLRWSAWATLVIIASLTSQARADHKDPDAPAGHSLHGEVFDEGPRQAAEIMGGTGKVNFPVEGASDKVQAFINQGIGQLHGFWYFEAERSFRQAAALDPQCAIAYLGMAMANVNNNKRARQFMIEAVKRRDSSKPREALWIDALAEFYDVKASDLEDAKGEKSSEAKKKPTKSEAELRKQLIKRLENISYEYPDDIEAKAFLVGLLWGSREKGVPIVSYAAVDALLDAVFAAEPMHPAHHYRIHLWDEEKPARALGSAALCGPVAPSIAHMWHMPGHIYTKLRRYHDAAWQQEAAARVDHAYMIRNHVAPDQIHNYAHNQEWLIRTLAINGQVHKAVDLSKNMIALPRHPKYNTLSKSGTSATFGRTRLVELLSRFELWDEAIAMADSLYLEPTENRQEQAKRLRLLAAALFATGDTKRGVEQIGALEIVLASAIAEEKANAKKKKPDESSENTSSEEKQDTEKQDTEKQDTEKQDTEKQDTEKQDTEKQNTEKQNTSNNRRSKKPTTVTAIEQALAELRGHQAVADGDLAKALPLFEKAKLGKEFLSRAYLEAGNKEKAETLARQAADTNKDQVYAQANFVEILQKLDKPDEAANALGRLRAISATLDMDLPIVRRLAPLAAELNLPTDWRRPAIKHDDIGERPAFDTLGPATWSPTSAATFELPTADDRVIRLEEYSGRPVVLIFYLGFGCLHCVEQLQTFGPMTSQFEEAGISLLAISSDTTEALGKSIAKVANEGAFPIPLVSDASLATFKAYRAFDDFEQRPLHATVVLDRRGRILWQDIGPEPFTDAKFVLNEAKRLLALWQ